MPTSDLCAESANSTDCLLRSLIKLIEDHNNSEDAEYNWDPLTFAFTAPIGVLATALTLIAVFQAFLTASTGRRKADRRAIGSWSKLTRKKWSWRDLNTLSYATTPVLRSVALAEILEMEQKQSIKRKPEARPFRRRVSPSPNAKSDEETAATWPRFMAHLGLAGQQDHFDKSFNVKTTLMEYLPADLLAAPAYGQVAFIIATAAAAGAQTIRTDGQSPYPVIVGKNFQFDFRQHPTLGVVGAFSFFEASAYQRMFARIIDPSLGTVQNLRLACNYAEGRLDMAVHWRGDKIESRGFWGLMNTVDLLSSGKIMPSLPFDHLWGNSRAGHKLLSKPELKCHVWLLLADAPTDVPTIFPRKKATPDLNIVTMLPLNSRFWLSCGCRNQRDLTDSGTLVNILKKDGTDVYLTNHLSLSGHTAVKVQLLRSQLRGDTDMLFIFEHRNRTKFKPLFKQRIDEKKDGKARICLVEIVLQTCVQLLHDVAGYSASLEAMGSLDKEVFRGLILFQIQELDRWLPRHGNMLQRQTAKYHGLMTILLEVEEAIAEGKFGYDNLSRRNTDLGERNQITTFSHLPPEVDGRHSSTIETLHDFLKQFQHVLDARGDDDKEAVMKDVACQFAQPLSYILKIIFSNGLSHPELACQTVATLKDLSNNWLPRKSAEQQDSGSQGDETDSIEEAIDTILVWRALLVYILFSTTPLDSSDLLDSGIWDHIVPIL